MLRHVRLTTVLTKEMSTFSFKNLLNSDSLLNLCSINLLRETKVFGSETKVFGSETKVFGSKY